MNTDQLSPKQAEMFAKMYAEKEGLHFEGWHPSDDGPVGHFYELEHNEVSKPIFVTLDLNIVMGLLEWWAKDPCQSYNRYYLGGHYKLSLIRDIGEFEPHTIEGSNPNLIIAIAEALEKIKE